MHVSSVNGVYEVLGLAKSMGVINLELAVELALDLGDLLHSSALEIQVLVLVVPLVRVSRKRYLIRVPGLLGPLLWPF